LRPGVGGARAVGQSPAVTLVWNPTKHVSVLVGYVHFFAGSFFRDNPPDKDTEYITAWINYTF
jgi:hypothetical protein